MSTGFFRVWGGGTADPLLISDRTEAAIEYDTCDADLEYFTVRIEKAAPPPIRESRGKGKRKYWERDKFGRKQ